MYYTIPTRWRRWYLKNQVRNEATIELPNGMKCNADFFWFAVELGILSEDD